MDVNKLLHYETNPSPSQWMIELFAEKKIKLDAVNNGGEIADEELSLPWVFALSEGE